MVIEMINIVRKFSKITRVITFVLILSTMALAGQGAEDVQPDPSLLTVKRIFGDEEFESESLPRRLARRLQRIHHYRKIASLP